MQNQLVIQIILIAVFVSLAIVLILPVKGARRLAIRRLLLLVAAVAAVVAIAWPDAVNWIANLVGVGRGTDLVLYALVIVFIGTSISNSVRFRQLERDVTALARLAAIAAAPSPRAETPVAGERTVDGAPSEDPE